MRLRILQDAANARAQEDMLYQINIDNFRMAINSINKSGDTSLFKHRDELARLLGENLHQQKVNRVMLDVINQQIGGGE